VVKCFVFPVRDRELRLRDTHKIGMHYASPWCALSVQRRCCSSTWTWMNVDRLGDATKEEYCWGEVEWMFGGLGILCSLAAAWSTKVDEDETRTHTMLRLAPGFLHRRPGTCPWSFSPLSGENIIRARLQLGLGHFKQSVLDIHTVLQITTNNLGQLVSILE